VIDVDEVKALVQPATKKMRVEAEPFIPAEAAIPTDIAQVPETTQESTEPVEAPLLEKEIELAHQVAVEAPTELAEESLIEDSADEAEFETDVDLTVDQGEVAPLDESMGDAMEEYDEEGEIEEEGPYDEELEGEIEELFLDLDNEDDALASLKGKFNSYMRD
jgi:hypothetical protein